MTSVICTQMPGTATKKQSVAGWFSRFLPWNAAPDDPYLAGREWVYECRDLGLPDSEINEIWRTSLWEVGEFDEFDLGVRDALKGWQK